AEAAWDGRPCGPWRSATAVPSSWIRARPAARASRCACRWSGPRGRRTSDLYDHRQHHRPALEPLVDEPRDVVVQVLLKQRDLPDLLLRRSRQGVLDGLAKLVEQRLSRPVQERDAPEDQLRRRDRAPVLL